MASQDTEPNTTEAESQPPITGEILPTDDDRLRQVCSPVDEDILDETQHEHDSNKLIDALQNFRQQHGFGRAIAAPQIGWQTRVIALNLGKKYEHLPGVPRSSSADATFIMINPTIIFKSDETFTLWDDCMSFPDTLVKVTRHKQIGIKWFDNNDTEYEWPAETIGLDLSELLQHEINHLDGILSIDDATETVPRSVYFENKEKYDAMVDHDIYSYQEKSSTQ